MKAVIFGLMGLTLSAQERTFFEQSQPLGFILFRRNCQSPEQIKTLVADLKSTIHHTDVPILIDQEGGRVVRLLPPHFRSNPPAHHFGDIYTTDQSEALNLVTENYSLIAQELLDLGINTNCAPCADILYKGSDPIIGDRAFSSKIETTATLSTATILAHSANGVMPVIKHLPGHGRANVDSHVGLPIIDTDRNTLIQTDFKAFKDALSPLPVHPWGMTAHIIYSAFDSEFCATESPTIINDVIRGLIGFNGFLISDCISMKALSGTYSQRATRALDAGCDAILYCMGDLDVMREIAAVTPDLSKDVLDRCFMRPAGFGTVLTYTKDTRADREILFKNRMTEWQAKWTDQASTIGE
ncbi:MAG: beta-N-acetylhexosaminidase [Candidatus Paracaedibacteraceae bacterium]|nr:beta-N-acetylhexosaminidase [Candidatus Paracaedibacteraceae bacterium]